MKLWSFIKWQWAKCEAWQKWFIFTAFLFVIGVTSKSTVGAFCLGFSISIFFYFITKWFLVDPIRNSWEEFKKEQNGLFDTIKDSDKK